MTSTCTKKCIRNKANGTLEVGELTCLDRCVSKYWDTQEVVIPLLTQNLTEPATNPATK